MRVMVLSIPLYSDSEELRNWVPNSFSLLRPNYEVAIDDPVEFSKQVPGNAYPNFIVLRTIQSGL